MDAGEPGPADAGELGPADAGEDTGGSGVGAGNALTEAGTPGSDAGTGQAGPEAAPGGSSWVPERAESGEADLSAGASVGDLREPGEEGPADASTEEPAAIADADRAEVLAESADATGPRDARETELAEPVSSHAIADTGQATETAMHVSEADEGEPADAEPPEVGGLPEAGPSVSDTMSGDTANTETDATDRAGVRSDVAAEHPDLYTRPDSPPPDVDGPHESPERWSADINPANGKNNCGDCARAVQETWEGSPQVAAVGGPEDNSLMTDWAGASPEPTSIESVSGKLTEQGHGSSAIVGFDWEDGGGHWFNAVNENGSIKAIDGQSGQVEAWPPSDPGLGFSTADMKNMEAIFFDSNGRVVR